MLSTQIYFVNYILKGLINDIRLVVNFRKRFVLQYAKRSDIFTSYIYIYTTKYGAHTHLHDTTHIGGSGKDSV